MATSQSTESSARFGRASHDPASSLRYQALSADSYRLDSPPFTGAAVTGAGPVVEGPGAPDERVANAGSTARSDDMDCACNDPDSRADRDVPQWVLDSGAQPHSDAPQRTESATPAELDEELDEPSSAGETQPHSHPHPHPHRSPCQVPRQGQSMDTYEFPRHRFPERMRDETKTPLVIVACGSFSPPTYLHL